MLNKKTSFYPAFFILVLIPLLQQRVLAQDTYGALAAQAQAAGSDPASVEIPPAPEPLRP